MSGKLFKTSCIVFQSCASLSHITFVPVQTDTLCNLTPLPTALRHSSMPVVFVITVIILYSCRTFAILKVPTPSMLLANMGKKFICLPEFLNVKFLVISTSLRDDKVERFGCSNTSSKLSFAS